MAQPAHPATPNAITTAARTPRYGACYAGEHAGLGLAVATRMAGATAGVVSPHWVAALARVASTPSELAVLGQA